MRLDDNGPRLYSSSSRTNSLLLYQVKLHTPVQCTLYSVVPCTGRFIFFAFDVVMNHEHICIPRPQTRACGDINKHFSIANLRISHGKIPRLTADGTFTLLHL